MLFVLIDSHSQHLKNLYAESLCKISSNLRNKLQSFGDVLYLSTKDFSHAQALYQYLAHESKGRDLLVLDAYAAALCTEDLKDFLAYQQKNRYEVLFAENLPEGLLPTLIDASFLSDLVPLIPGDLPSSVPFKKLINWEYKGIDIGIWLSPSAIVLERISFLPVDGISVRMIEKISSQQDFSIAKAEAFLKNEVTLCHSAPRYCAVELSNHEGVLSLENAKKIIHALDLFAPEAVLSLGIHGEIFTYPYWDEFLPILGTERTVLVESPSFQLDESLAERILRRPHTELIITHSTESLDFAKKFADTQHLWVRIWRDKNTEHSILDFLKDYAFLDTRAIVAKADSFGDTSLQSVDLAPINRHACYSLGRELLFNTSGDSLVCRQSPQQIHGNIQQQSIEQLWTIRQELFLKQRENPSCAVCPLCPSCDDWWIFNY